MYHYKFYSSKSTLIPLHNSNSTPAEILNSKDIALKLNKTEPERSRGLVKFYKDCMDVGRVTHIFVCAYFMKNFIKREHASMRVLCLICWMFIWPTFTLKTMLCLY